MSRVAPAEAKPKNADLVFRSVQCAGMVRFLRSREVTHIVRWVSDAETCDACVGDRWRCCDTTGFVRVRVLGFEDYDSFGDVWTALSRTRQTQKLVTPTLL